MEASQLLKDILDFIKKYYWLVLLLGIIGGLIGKFTVPEGPPPTYQSSASVLIEKEFKEKNIIINQTDETTRFLNTAQTLAKAPFILEAVIKELELNKKVKDLQNIISVSNENGSHIIKVTVEDINQELTTNVANSVVNIFHKEIGNYLSVEKVIVVEEAIPGQENIIIHERPRANILMGVILGLVMGSLASLILYRRKERGK